MKKNIAILLTVSGLGMSILAGCTPSEPDGPTLSFLLERERWLATEVNATVETVPSADGARQETSLQIVAKDGESGEQVTFLVLVEADPVKGLLGTHPVRVFGSLASMDPVAGYERLQGVSNACTPNDLSLTSGTLTIESQDAEGRFLSGSFITNVCNVSDTEKAWTLGDGKFADLSY